MPVEPEYRDRPDEEVAVLDALVDRSEEGMTVFELRSHVDVGIDDLEEALERLNDDGLVTVEEEAERNVILPADHVVPESDDRDHEESLFDRIRRKLPL